jgi:hypothetical protein
MHILECLKLKRATISKSGKDMKELQLSYTASRNVFKMVQPFWSSLRVYSVKYTYNTIQ